jgi:hypothetical protein
VVLSRIEHASGRVRPRARPGWVRSQASKSCRLTRWNSSTDLPTSEPEETTSGAYNQSHSTCVKATASGVIRSTITWSGTRFRNTVGLIVAA